MFDLRQKIKNTCSFFVSLFNKGGSKQVYEAKLRMAEAFFVNEFGAATARSRCDVHKHLQTVYPETTLVEAWDIVSELEIRGLITHYIRIGDEDLYRKRLYFS